MFKTKTLQFILLCAVGVLLSPPQAGAQNFANTAFDDYDYEVEEIDANQEEELLSQALVDSGVPINTGTELDVQSESNYSLGPEDVIEISVLRHPEVSGQYIINREGKIQYEFVGDLEVAGMTKNQLTGMLEKKLGEYIISPQVTVKIIGYNSKVVYVIGEVGNPGKIFMRGDTITVREALIQAGLPLLSAKTTKGVLITPNASGNAPRQRVNVHKLLYEGDLRENFEMKPGDTLYVPPTFMAKTLRAIQPVAQPIGTAAGAGRSVYGF